jgi:hypothetical protein
MSVPASLWWMRGPAAAFVLALPLMLAGNACEIDEGGLPETAGSDRRIVTEPVDAAADLPGVDGPDVPDLGDDSGAPPVDAGDDQVIDAADDGSPVVDAGSPEAGETGPLLCQHCANYGTPRTLGTIPLVIKELSGLAASTRHPGVLYAHNDSGDTARFFAVDETAALLGEMDLPGATNIDWEDIAVGACPAGSCVYLSDSGDNDVKREQYKIYRVAEPPTFPGAGATMNVTYEQFPFVYPDGSHNAETLLVHPQTGRVFIVLKEAGIPATVYEMPLPLQADKVVTVVKVGSLSVPANAGLVTGGSFHPCGDRILIRTKQGLYELASAQSGDVTSVFGAPATAVPVAAEAQGEAVEYAPDGLRYFTSSETGGGPTPLLSVVECLSAARR